jgi:hypothetical protein
MMLNGATELVYLLKDQLWRAGMSDHPSTITAKVRLICLNRIRGKFLNVIFNQICLICILGINQLKENFLAKL